MFRTTTISCRTFIAMMLLALAWLTAPQTSLAQDCDLARPLNSQRTTVLPNNKLFTINVGGSPLRVLFHWDDLPATDVDPADGVPDLVTSLLDQIETTMNAFAAMGFRRVQVASVCDGDVDAYSVFVYQAVGDNNGGGTAYDSVFDFRFTQGDEDSTQIDVVSRNTIAHELFHSVQFAYPISDFQQWLVEGTAKLAPDLVDAELDASRIDSPAGITSNAPTCEEQFLQRPWHNLVRRNSRFGDGSNVCTTKLFWRYFIEQIGENATEPAVGADALVDLFELISDRPSGWRIREIDRIIGAGDFDGDGREEWLVQSDTHIGLIASTFGRNRILNVTGVGARLGSNGWKLHASDVLSSIGDYNGDGKDEFVINSGTHIGFIGLDRRQRLRTLKAVLKGAGRFGDGWVPNTYDRLLGVADVDGDGSEELLLSNSRYVGLVGLTPRNETRSLAIRARGGLDSETVRILADSARVAGTGDLDRDGREEFAMQDLLGIYSFRLTPGGRFSVLASVDGGETLPAPGGSGWRLNPDAGIRGVGGVIGRRLGFPGSVADQIIVQDRNGFAALDYDGAGGFVVRSVYSVGANFGDGARYSNDLEIVDVADMDDAAYAEIVFRQADEIGILRWDRTKRGLRRIASRRHSDYRTATLSTARLNGGGAHVLSRTPLLWRTIAYHSSASDLVGESTQEVGKYVDDLISRMDELIRAKTGGSRDFDSLWRDFSIALYTKDLNVNSLETPYYFVDEQTDGYSYHHDSRRSGPPVKTILRLLPYVDTGRTPETIDRWSADYIRLEPDYGRGQRVLVNVVPQRGQGRLSVTVVITERGRLVQMDRDANPRGGVLAQYYDLTPEQELGLIIVATDEAPDYSYRIVSSRRE